MCHTEVILQGFLSRTDEHITELQEEVKRKDEEIVFLRSMLASLSEKVDQLEKTAIGRMGESVAMPSHLLPPPLILFPPSLFLHCAPPSTTEEIEQRQTKMQREVVEARHGVNFTLVS